MLSHSGLARALKSMGVACAAMIVVGCGQPSGPTSEQLRAERDKFLLKAEPSGAVGVLDARESLPSTGSVVMVGKIGGTGQPWVDGKAAFVIVDPSCGADAEHCHHGPDDNCPFCAKKQPQSDSLAIVQFVDDRGELLPYGAQSLFELAANQTVVVEGKAKINELGTLVVMASGIYVRR